MPRTDTVPTSPQRRGVSAAFRETQATPTPRRTASMTAAVELINEGKVPTQELLGEVFSLDGFDEAMSLLKREHPERDAIRVTIRHG